MDQLEDIYLAENTFQHIRRGEEPLQNLSEIERELELDLGMDR